LRRIIHLQDELMRLTNLPQPPQEHHSRQNSTTLPATDGTNGAGQHQGRSLLSAGANLGRAVVVPAVVGRNVFAAAGAGLRDLIVPESLATAITSNLNLNLNLVPWGGSNDGKDTKSVERAKERAEKLKVELDELLAAACPLCESLVVGLDKPFVLPGEVDHSWDL
jgi:vacuolar protein sorting-associated protein 18